MRVTIVCMGSRGDVQPGMALGLLLRQRGHLVRLAGHASFRDWVERRGLDFALLEPDFGAELDAALGTSREGGPLRVFLAMLRSAHQYRRRLDTLPGGLWEACRDADAIVFPKVFGLACYYIARALGIPGVAMALQPADPTGAFPSLALPPGINLGTTLNRASHSIALQALLWQPFRRSTNVLLRQTVRTTTAPLSGPLRTMQRERVPVLYAFSRHVVPRPRDWDDRIHVTGYWFLEREPEWHPPPAVQRFLASGPPPVYVGFGSMPAGSEQTGRTVIEALRKSGQRGLLAGRWDGRLTDTQDILVVGDVAHDWLFPQVAAVVHHSGAGTTSATLRAGVPSIHVPLLLDQPFWAHRVKTLGAGPAPIPRAKLNADRLAAAIRASVMDDGIKARAAALGRAIRSENGVAVAADLFEAYTASFLAATAAGAGRKRRGN